MMPGHGIARGWAAILMLLLAAPVTAGGSPLMVNGNRAVLERAPMLVAADRSPAGTVAVGIGDVRSLWPQGEGVVAADLAGNAETQALRASLQHPDVRILMTVAEGHYRIVARRSAGIATLADLKGKRIATTRETSAAYYLHRVLDRAGLSEADVTIVNLGADGSADALIAGNADALAMWEPFSTRARQALGEDVIILDAPGAYRELYNLNTTAERLADPAKRAQIVDYVRRLLDACEDAQTNPARMQERIASASGHDVGLVRASWGEHRFSCELPNDLIDVMVAQEEWLAKLGGREPRPRAALEMLIDGSLLAEARKDGGR